MSERFVSTKSKITLIPWDPDNEQHVERMYHQRVACTWKAEMIGTWQKEHKRGYMSLHWVVLDDADKDKDDKIAKHVAKYPNEAEPLSDTATSLYRTPRTPSHQKFVPVGHIALDEGNLTDPTEDAVETGLFWVTSLYISRAIHNAGLGRAAFDAIEQLASHEPWNAKILGLDTMDKNWKPPAEMAKMGLPAATIVNQEWYERRGYTVYRHWENGYIYKPCEGVEIGVSLVFMKKPVQ